MSSSAASAAPPPASTAAALADVNAFKFAGVVAWHGALFLLAGGVWRATDGRSSLGAAVSPGWLVFLALLYALGCVPVLLCQRWVLTTIDVPPLYVGRLGWGSKSWPCLLLSRCLLRQRTARSIAHAAAFYATCCVCALLWLPFLLPAGTKGSRGMALYSISLALLYATGYLIRGKNVLSFPVLQRHRYFRIKQRLPALAKSTLWLASLSLLAASLASALLLHQAAWPSWTAAAAAWRGACLLLFGWASGAAVLEIVFTERVAMAAEGDVAPTAPLLEALQHPDPIVQDWCLLDLAGVAEGAAGTRCRRAALFADETGASGWVPLSRYCLTELQHFVGVLGGALPALRGSAASGAGVRWNSLQLSASGLRPASAAQDTALWHLQARHLRLVSCMRALSGLAASGLALDKYGLLSLSSPNLGDVLAALLGVVAVLQAYVRHTSAIPSRPASPLAHLLERFSRGGSGAGNGSSSSSGSQQHVDAAACALLDVAKTCTYRLTNTYGGVLASLVGARQPLVGTTAEAQALLASFLACEQ